MLKYKQKHISHFILNIADIDLLDRLISNFDTKRDSFEAMNITTKAPEHNIINDKQAFMTHAEIGAKLGVCGQHIRNIERKAIRKLYKQAKKYNLRDFLTN